MAASFTRLVLGIYLAMAALFLIPEAPVHAEGQQCERVSDCLPNSSDQKSQPASNQNKKPVTTDQSETNAESSPSTFMTFIKLIASLAIILALIYGLYRLLAKRAKVFRQTGPIKTIGGVSVGPNRSVQLIRIGEEILVIGVGESVQLLKEINDPVTVAELLEEEREVATSMPKNVSKVFHWVKEQTGISKSEGQKKDSIAQSFSDELQRLLKTRTDEIEKRFKKGHKP